MLHYTESMDGLQVVSRGVKYVTTGKRYLDLANMLYWYEAEGEVWLLGNSMRYVK